MPTGPCSCADDVSPVNRPPSVLKISPLNSMFRSTLSCIASSGPGVNDFGRLGDADADHAAVALAARA